MRSIIRRASSLIFLISLHLFVAVSYAQEAPAGRVVTLTDWGLRLPILGLIVLFTLVVTGVFFYFAVRNLQRTRTPQN